LKQRNASGPSRIFKGDPAEEYEFTAQITQDDPMAQDGGVHLMGMMPVYADDQNYLQATIDPARSELRVTGRKAGQVLPIQTAPLPRRFPLPASEQTGQLWRSTMQAPGADWTGAGFSDDGWEPGEAGFGNTACRTVWDVDDIWLRRNFNLDETPTGMARLWLRLQGETAIYLNGVLALRETGSAAGYGAREIADEARATLQKGTNTIAIHAHKTGARQAVDAGLFLAGIVEYPGSVNLRAVKLKERVILFVNGQQRLEVPGSWPASQVGLLTEAMACHFSGLTHFRIH
jgi:hypothetical protein